jgi:hypothetical protein
MPRKEHRQPPPSPVEDPRRCGLLSRRLWGRRHAGIGGRCGRCWSSPSRIRERRSPSLGSPFFPVAPTMADSPAVADGARWGWKRRELRRPPGAEELSRQRSSLAAELALPTATTTWSGEARRSPSRSAPPPPVSRWQRRGVSGGAPFRDGDAGQGHEVVEAAAKGRVVGPRGASSIPLDLKEMEVGTFLGSSSWTPAAGRKRASVSSRRRIPSPVRMVLVSQSSYHEVSGTLRQVIKS